MSAQTYFNYSQGTSRTTFLLFLSHRVVIDPQILIFTSKKEENGNAPCVRTMLGDLDYNPNGIRFKYVENQRTVRGSNPFIHPFHPSIPSIHPPVHILWVVTLVADLWQAQFSDHSIELFPERFAHPFEIGFFFGAVGTRYAGHLRIDFIDGSA